MPPYLGAPVLTAGAVLVVCVDLNVCAAFDQYLDRIGVIPGASVYPFVWNILLAARNEGYGGVLTTMAVAEEPRVKELLGIPEDYAIAALLTDRQTGETGQEAHAQARFGVRHQGPFRRRAAVATYFLAALAAAFPRSLRSCPRAAFICFLYDRTFSSEPASTMSATERCVPALP